MKERHKKADISSLNGLFFASISVLFIASFVLEVSVIIASRFWVAYRSTLIIMGVTSRVQATLYVVFIMALLSSFIFKCQVCASYVMSPSQPSATIFLYRACSDNQRNKKIPTIDKMKNSKANTI